MGVASLTPPPAPSNEPASNEARQWVRGEAPPGGKPSPHPGSAIPTYEALNVELDSRGPRVRETAQAGEESTSRRHRAIRRRLRSLRQSNRAGDALGSRPQVGKNGLQGPGASALQPARGWQARSGDRQQAQEDQAGVARVVTPRFASRRDWRGVSMGTVQKTAHAPISVVRGEGQTRRKDRPRRASLRVEGAGSARPAARTEASPRV